MHVTHESGETCRKTGGFLNAGGTADNDDYSPRNTTKYSGAFCIVWEKRSPCSRNAPEAIVTMKL
ncbi:MAG: hypothetical protein K2O73_07070 [Lachnospiraceae bacterium]|nr:hypothetical protein [Lachnospiraceae bacterium]MDE7435759.1 hypothetical protein [Lachnospiraceae bacterium]